MGFHVVYPGQADDVGDEPEIRRDGGTGSWRDAKKLVRQWYLDKAAALRGVTEKSYFGEEIDGN